MKQNNKQLTTQMKTYQNINKKWK